MSQLWGVETQSRSAPTNHISRRAIEGITAQRKLSEMSKVQGPDEWIEKGQPREATKVWVLQTNLEKAREARDLAHAVYKNDIDSE